MFYYLLSFTLILIGILLIYKIYITKPKTIHKDEVPVPPQTIQSTRFKGLVLFDVDGTLTTGTNNEEIVEMCINDGWAVGICTAGYIYNMDNLLNFSWMPKNLHNFIKQYGNVTFNNTASGFLLGKLNREAYEKVDMALPPNINIMGFRKGFALTHTGHALGITDPKFLVLCDDMNSFIKGALTFNPGIQIVCSGADCGGKLSIETVGKAIGHNSPS